MVRQIRIMIAPRRGIGLVRTRDAIERAEQRPVLRDEPLLARLRPQELADRVVQAQRAPVEIETRQQREVGQLVEKILALGRVEPAGLGPQSRDDVDRNIGVFGKNAELAESCVLSWSRRSRLTPMVRATAFVRSDSLRASNAINPLLSSRVFTSAIARSSGCFLPTRSRRYPLTNFNNSAHSPSR